MSGTTPWAIVCPSSSCVRVPPIRNSNAEPPIIPIAPIQSQTFSVILYASTRYNTSPNSLVSDEVQKNARRARGLVLF